MTLADLKQLSEQLKTDAEFLAHPDVRRVWWKCLGVSAWRHEHLMVGWAPCCDVPDPIPGSLADAVERLREKVAEKCSLGDGDVRYRYAGLIDPCEAIDNYRDDTPRQRFLVFAAALNGVV